MDSNRIGDTAVPPTGVFIAGNWQYGKQTFEVLDKYSSICVARVTESSEAQIAEAATAARGAADMGPPPPYDRSEMLRRAAALVSARKSEFVDLMVAEAGFILTDASTEVDRAIVTLKLSADEALRITGEMVPFAGSPGAHRRIGFTQRFPVGVVCAITPFNSPLNTVLHKIAPAYAAGNAVILKPSAFTPLTSALLTQVLQDAGMPAGFMNLVQGGGDSVGNELLKRPEVDFYTFTGSTRVGRIIQQAAGLRRTQMELGSIASTIVCADANLDRAISKIAAAALRKAGQVCTSVQRLYVARGLYEETCDRLVRAAAELPAGNPRDQAVRVGPMISLAAAERAERWIGDAAASGSRILCGGQRSGSVVNPTVLVDTADRADLWCSEAFAPVLSIRPFDDLESTIRSANATPYGLAAGIFTQDIDLAMRAGSSLRFGTVHINETSSARADVMPFGGVKDSGFGREGPAYAIREMTEERLLVIHP